MQPHLPRLCFDRSSHFRPRETQSPTPQPKIVSDPTRTLCRRRLPARCPSGCRGAPLKSQSSFSVCHFFVFVASFRSFEISAANRLQPPSLRQPCVSRTERAASAASPCFGPRRVHCTRSCGLSFQLRRARVASRMRHVSKSCSLLRAALP